MDYAASKTVEMHGALRIERYVLADRPYVCIYRGKAAKPIAHYRFKSLERADAFVASEKEKEAARVAYQATRKAERSAKAAAFVMPYKVGDVLHGSWGWEQTNCEFAEVVEIKGKRGIVIRGISSKSAGGPGYSHGMADELLPLPGVFVGEPLARVVDLYGGVKWNDHCSMRPWDGSPKYSSWYA